ncbi:hypothetical protein KUTeg_019925, partial [Tegillarca granosa]
MKRLFFEESSCADVLDNCAAYGASVCSDQQYTQWVLKNCQKTCNKCGKLRVRVNVLLKLIYSDYLGAHVLISSRTVKHMEIPPVLTQSMINGQKQIALLPAINVVRCVYKGKVYQQGQSWKDGCSFKCSCDDGTLGKYTCKQLCVTWNLPDVCTMTEPVPGKCCKTPNCPPYIEVKCVNWSLPNSCSLNEPAPGKCCKTPNCPPSVQLTYPPNY